MHWELVVGPRFPLKTAAINRTNRCNYVKMMETRVSDAAAHVIRFQASDKAAVWTFPRLKDSLYIILFHSRKSCLEV